MEKKEHNHTLRWLYSVTGKKKLYILALTALQTVGGGIGVLYALLLRNIVDRAVSRNAAAFRASVFQIVGLVILQLSVSAVIRRINELARSDMENLFKQRLFHNILRKDYSAVSSVHTAEWLNRLTNDTVVVSGGIVDILPGLTGMGVRLISVLTMIIVLDRWFAWILIPGGILVVILTYLFRNILKKMHKAIQESDGQLRIFLQERISSLMVIKSFAAEVQTEKLAAEKMEDHKAARMKRNAFSNFANIGFGAAMQGMYLIGAIYCAHGIMVGRVSYGTLTAIMQLVGQVQAPFAIISGYLPRWYAMTASAERLMEAESFSDDAEVSDASIMQQYYRDQFQTLGLRNAMFRYETEDGPMVLKDVSLEIHKKEYVAFTGHSGCGKSTVLKLLMSMFPLDAGERFIDGNPLTAEYRRLFAYVPQGNVLMSGTIREVVSFPAPAEMMNEEKLSRTLVIACADEFVNKMDAGVDTMLGERGTGLSEGQMQRLSIARAIFSDAPILLLDEATSALDAETERHLLENLRLLTDKTVVIVTHRKAALEICDKVIEFGDQTPDARYNALDYGYEEAKRWMER